MKKLISILFAVIACQCPALTLTHISLTNSAPKIFTNINYNLDVLAANGGGGVSSTDLVVTNTFTLTKQFVTPGYLQWTNPPAWPTNVAPPTTTCTNQSGPYYPDPVLGTNYYTNACGYVIIYGDGFTNTFPGLTNPAVYIQNTNTAVSNLYSLSVTSTNLTAGTYIWTNGAFYLGGIAPNANTCPSSNAWISFDTSDGAWWWQASMGASSHSWGTNLIATIGPDTISAVSYNTSYGFPYGYLPSFDFFVSGAGTTNFNGLYRFAGSLSTYPVSFSPGLLYGERAQVFTNSSNPLYFMTYNDPYGNAFVTNDTQAAAWQLWFPSWTATAYTTYLPGALSGSGASAPKPTVVALPNSGSQTNVIAIGTYDPVVFDTLIGKVVFHTNSACTYLATTGYWMNYGTIYLDTNGTAFVIKTILTNLTDTVTTIPQTDTNQWLVCP